MMRKVGVPLSIVLAAAATTAIAASPGGGRSAAKAAKPLPYEVHDLYIETNATDGDAGLQLSADAEEWRSFKLRDPNGRLLVDIGVKGRMRKFGLSELFFEASEPPFTKVPLSAFKRRFPEGVYRFSGVTPSGRRLAGSDRLSHLIPAAPKVTFPTAGAHVDPNGFKVTWEPVTTPAGVHIVSYQVIVDQGGRELSMYLPASARSATIPGEFLVPGSKATGEILARERSGNQTIAELPAFRTR